MGIVGVTFRQLHSVTHGCHAASGVVGDAFGLLERIGSSHQIVDGFRGLAFRIRGFCQLVRQVVLVKVSITI